MKTFATLCVAALMTGAVAQAQAADYPSRDITDVVTWSAGGGTDVSNRVVAAEMAKFLPVRINVVNKPGGVAGSIGMSYAHSQPADGYTLVGVADSNTTSAVMGGWDQTFKEWYPFLIGGSPDLISVTADSPYKTLTDLIEAAKANPGSIKASAGGAGGIHHINLLALEKGTGASFNFIPYPGSAPAQNAAMTGEVTAVITSLAEQLQLLRAGKIRPLAMLVEDGVTVDGVGEIASGFGDYPGLSEYLPIQQTLGIAIRQDAPDDVKATLGDAFSKAMETDAVKKWAADNFYVLSGKTGEEAQKEYLKLESVFSWALHDLGAAKIDPATLGISKP